MTSTWEKKEKSTGDLKVTLEGDEWKQAQTKAFHKLQANVQIHGFRKGQAPEGLVRKYINNSEVFYEAIDQVANKALQDAVSEQKLFLVDRPTLDVESVTEDKAVLVYHCTVRPDVKLGQYKGLEYTAPDTNVTAEEIKERLEQIQKDYTEQVVKEDGTVEKGDLAIIDYEGSIDGVPFDGGKGENYSLEIGSNTFIPGFEDQLIGMKKGEEKEIKVTFPEDYGAKDLAGKEATFKVKVNEVKQNVVPALDDDLAKDTDQEGVETLKDLEEKIKKEIGDGKLAAAEDKIKNDLLEKATNNAEIDVPQVMVEDEKNYLLENFKSRIGSQGIPFDQYIKLIGKTEAEVRDELGKDAEQRVRSSLVLNEISSQEKLEVTDEDIENEYKKMADQYHMDVEQVKKYVRPADLQYDLSLQKALNFLKDNGVPVEKKPEEKPAEDKPAEEKPVEEKPEEKAAE